MTKEQLSRITNDIVNNVMRNGDIVYGGSEQIPYLLDVIASLHNLLSIEVTGSAYDYMFHWTNKIGYNGIDDDIYDKLMEE